MYECRSCDSRLPLYNSCVDRHCPQCRGAKRADWFETTAARILPNVNYFQVVFTVPDTLSSLMLANRRELYTLLFQAAWESLNGLLRQSGQFQPAAQMVLHTWNQRLDHHPHIHALVPGGGPSLDGLRWVTAKHAKHKRRRKPFLVDAAKLREAFRGHYMLGLRKLLAKGQLLSSSELTCLNDLAARESWLKELEERDWNVYIQGPPGEKSKPEHVVKYLARYLAGGPISDARLIADAGSKDDGRVTFWARTHEKSKRKRTKNRSMPFELSGREFVRRWSMHILPKGFSRTRVYGGYHTTKAADYLANCRQLLGVPPIAPESPSDANTIAEPTIWVPTCRHCETNMVCIAHRVRPSWRYVFERAIYESTEYSPMHHLPKRKQSVPLIGTISRTQKERSSESPSKPTPQTKTSPTGRSKPFAPSSSNNSRDASRSANPSSRIAGGITDRITDRIEGEYG